MSAGRFDLGTFRSERTNEASTLTITPKRSSSRDVGSKSKISSDAYIIPKKKQRVWMNMSFEEAVKKKNQEEFFSEVERTFGCEAIETDKIEIPEYTSPWKSCIAKKRQKEYQAEDFSRATEREVAEDRLKENLNAKKKKHLQGEQIISQDFECVHDSSSNGNIFEKFVKKKNKKEFTSEVERTFECEAVETDKTEIPKHTPQKCHKEKKKQKEYQAKDRLKENLSAKKKKHLQGEQIISQDLECVHDSSTNGKNSKKSVAEKNGEEFSSEAETTSFSKVVEIDNSEDSDYDLFSQSISLNFEHAPVNFSVPLLHEHEKLSVTAEMKKSLREKGVVIKYGRFSKEENTILKKNYQQFVEEFGIEDPCLLFGIGSTTRNSKVFRFLRAKHFYIRLGKGLGNRPLISIYKRARTLFNPLRSSKMFEKEEIAKLKHSYNFLGNKWTKIGNILGRSDMNCQMCYRWHAKEVNKGKWSSEEENNLINAIKTVAETDDISSNNIESISWGAVERLVPTRNAFQCRLYWGEHLAWDPSVTEKKPWNQSSYAKLIYLLKYKYCASSERKVNWKELQKYFIDVSPSYIFLAKKWAYLNYYAQKKITIFRYSKILDYLYKIYEKYIDVANFEAEISNFSDQ
ncbi:transcription termination factor 1 [Trichonephila clavipes]|nr:transcription termination factor 1 [Trichonephila clavipes]